MKHFFQFIWLCAKEVPALYLAPLIGTVNGVRQTIERKQHRIRIAFFKKHAIEA